MSSIIQDSKYIFRTRPKDFAPAIEVAACYIEFEGKFLFLKRASEKSQGGKWGVPAGKLEKGEAASEAVIRETREETGIFLSQDTAEFAGKLFFRHSGMDFVYHMFYWKPECLPEVRLNDEHEDYCWVSLEELETLPMMLGAVEALYHLKALVAAPKPARRSFYFIRHGETSVNADPNIKRVDYDLPLNERGRLQAQQAR